MKRADLYYVVAEPQVRAIFARLFWNTVLILLPPRELFESTSTKMGCATK